MSPSSVMVPVITLGDDEILGLDIHSTMNCIANLLYILSGSTSSSLDLADMTFSGTKMNEILSVPVCLIAVIYSLEITFISNIYLNYLRLSENCHGWHFGTQDRSHMSSTSSGKISLFSLYQCTQGHIYLSY